METFRWVTVIVSIILGFGLTRILTSAVVVFQARQRVKFDWIPLVWARTIFAQQISFWWSLDELSKLVSHWSFREQLFSLQGVLNLIVCVMPLIALFGSRGVQAVATAIHAPIVLLGIVLLAPSTY